MTLETNLLGTEVTWRNTRNGAGSHYLGIVRAVAYNEEAGFILLVLCTETRTLETLHTSEVTEAR